MVTQISKRHVNNEAPGILMVQQYLSNISLQQLILNFINTAG